MTEGKSPVDRVLDVVVFAPAGLAVTAAEEFPKLVSKGRHRIEGQVHTARLVGQFAVQFGRRQVEEWTKRAAPAPAGETATSPAEAGLALVTDPGHAAEVPPATERGGGGGEYDATDAGDDTDATGDAGVARAGTNGHRSAMHLAIPGYDSLSASQVVQRLDGLSSAELAEVREHELASRRRRTILSRVDQLLTSTPHDPA